MDIRSEKLELMQMLLNTKEASVLARIREVLSGSVENKDWWDEIDQEERSEIEEGLSQLDRGDHISHKEVQKEIKDRFNF